MSSTSSLELSSPAGPHATSRGWSKGGREEIGVNDVSAAGVSDEMFVAGKPPGAPGTVNVTSVPGTNPTSVGCAVYTVIPKRRIGRSTVVPAPAVKTRLSPALTWTRLMLVDCGT